MTLGEIIRHDDLFSKMYSYVSVRDTIARIILKKLTKRYWSVAQTKAFNILKHALTTKTLLEYFNLI